MVLSEATRILALPEMSPETMIVSGVSLSAASVRLARSDTVTVPPAAPPVVPPFWVQYPMGQLSAAWRRVNSLRLFRLLRGEQVAIVANRKREGSLMLARRRKTPLAAGEETRIGWRRSALLSWKDVPICVLLDRGFTASLYAQNLSSFAS